MPEIGRNGLTVFTTCPPSNRIPRAAYLQRVREVSQWSEAAGCEGILVYTDHGLVDPWIVAQSILTATESICPLVAVQPVYMHPYSVAKMVTSFGHLYGRRLHLNFVAGGFRKDLLAFRDATSHDDRYARLTEYALIVTSLLESERGVTFDGQYYAVRDLKLTPPLEAELQPGLMVSGSSDAGRAVARTIGATAVRYPEPADEGTGKAGDDALSTGIRIGIVAREDAAEAWRVARARFPAERKGQITHALAMSTSDSEWHRQLSASEAGDEDGPYWLHPFQNYQTFCPYLVGSYDRVGREVARYIETGVSTVILDVPASPDELEHIDLALSAAFSESVPGDQTVREPR